MKLNSIKIQNYRCYEDNDFEFGSDSTIIIGKNGTGKSSLLSAIRKGMTFIFSNTGQNSLIKNNTNKVEGLGDWDTTFKENGEGFQWPTEINYQINFDNNHLEWKFYKDKYKGKLHPRYYKDAQKKFEKYHLNNSSTLPLLGFYGDCYPHKKNDANAVVNSFNKVISKSKIIPRDAGYFLWNVDGSITPSWFLRTKFILNEIQHTKQTINDLKDDIELLKVKLSENNSEIFHNQLKDLENRFLILSQSNEDFTAHFEAEFNFIKNILLKFFSKENEFDSEELILFDIKKRRIDKSEILFFQFGNMNSFNEGVYSENSLPMGYQRLIHIVYDIAYRWFILNGVTDKFDGLVLIDELELHLHPSLQQTVLNRFRKTFPELQFIITTHSPIILSAYNSDNISKKIIQLEKINGKYDDAELGNLYSIDYNSTLIDIMGVNISNKLLDAYINAYCFLKEENNDLSQEYYNKIEELFDGSIPEHILQKL